VSGATAAGSCRWIFPIFGSAEDGKRQNQKLKQTMKKLLPNLIIMAVIMACAWPAMAQQKRTPVSPHETISEDIDGNKVTIVYGRPYSKNPRQPTEIRKIWGALVPYGKVWRTGADAATLLTIEQPIVIGGTDLPAGKYSLFTFPTEDGKAKLIINKKTGQWGIPYNEETEKANELARIDLKKETLDKDVDQFTMAILKNPAGGGTLKMMWEKTAFSVPFTVKK
jgi:hypothetical protein